MSIMLVIDKRLNDARRLLGLAIGEYQRGDKEWALNGVTKAIEQLRVLAVEMHTELENEPEPPTLLYHEGEIVEVVPVDKWTERDEALLVRPEGHCVSVHTPDGVRWEV